MGNTILAGAVLLANLTLTADDGTRIAATYRAPKPGPAAAAVILVPMYGNPRTTWEAFAQEAAKGGVASLAIDPRGHGDSANPAGKPVTQWGLAEWMGVTRDIRAARRHLAGLGFADRQVYLAGASIGASLALEYAVSDRTLGGLALLSVSTNLTGRTPEEDISRWLSRPLFLVWSQDDRQWVETSERMARAAGSRAVTRRYARAGHGTQMFGREDSPGDLARSLVTWMTNGKGPAAPAAAGPLDAALERARREGKPVLVKVHGATCQICKRMQQELFASPELARRIESAFVVCEVTDHTYDKAEPAGSPRRAQGRELMARLRVQTYPAVLVLDGAGRELGRTTGYQYGQGAEYVARWEKLARNGKTSAR